MSSSAVSSAPAPPPAAAAAAPVKAAVPALPEAEPIDEDDEFEDFPAETWGPEQLVNEEGEWADDWEDEELDTDFDKVLRAELEKHAAAAGAGAGTGAGAPGEAGR